MPDKFQEQVTEALRKASPDPGFPGTDTTVSDHGCFDGWLYADDNTAKRCPVCERAAALAKAEAQIRESGIGEKYLTVEWENLELVEPMPRVKLATENIAEIIESGENALLHGKPGTGKTQSAVLLVKAAIRAGYTARLENLGRLGMNIRAGYEKTDRSGPSEKSVVDQLSNVDLLVLDDIGAGETANAKVEQRILYLVTEARQNSVRPTVVTTNLTPAELTATIGQRIVNRLQPLATFAFAHGRNFRRRTDDYGSVW